MFRPHRVLITRQGSDGDPLRHVPGVVPNLPHVGESLQLFLENGKWMRTTPVTKIEHDGGDLVVDTRNSRYRLKLAA